MRRLSLVGAVVVAGVVFAAPAGAFNGGGVMTSLDRGKVLEVSAAGSRDQRSCQQNHVGSKTARKVAPVACEQPPRSEQLIPPDALSKAVASALASIG